MTDAARLKGAPFNLPTLIGKEIEYINEVLAGDQASGNGRFTELAQQELARLLGGGGRVLLTTSCSTALDMAAILSGIGPGDEVIMPSYTFTSTANAVVLRGA
ncbi:MAG TPA: DegT/DnrJ/EryC1/StrS family aminotransferase, partial [Reyranella sp.]|nr:DegT/DnrJ/EryC1/StrS family aminotransferase [Reyranella sp.]